MNRNALRNEARVAAQVIDNKTKKWWVMRGSNSRHLRCKRSRPSPIYCFYSNHTVFKQLYLPLFQSIPVHAGSVNHHALRKKALERI